jgi:hypothetical protein
MNSIGLIIQRTTSGLNDMFVSDNLKEIRSSIEIESTTDDENKYATKLANQSVVYSVQLTKNYRIYSYINTDATDTFGRAGFYAIRLYTPKKNRLTNFEERLNLINNKYVEFEKNGISKNSQDYSELLKLEINFEINQQEFICLKSKENAFFLYDINNTQLSNLFNEKSISFYNKVYAFNKEKAVATDLIKSIGLIEFNSSFNNLKEVLINNPYRVLKELKVNTISLDFRSEITEFSVVLKSGDNLEYNTTDNPKFKFVTGLNVIIEKKQIAHSKPNNQNQYKKNGFWEENGIYLTILFLTLILAGGAWYYFEENENKETKTNVIIVENTETKIDSTNIEFEFDGNSKDSSVFKTSYSKLNKYRFRLDNKKWSYKNTHGKNKYVSFYKTNLDEIIGSENIALSDSIKNILINNLEKISGQEIKEKDEIESTSSDNNSKKGSKKGNSEILEKRINTETKTETKTETETKKETKKEMKKEIESKSNSEIIKITKKLG